MIAIALMLLQPAQAQDLARGAKVFAQSCAVGYCHGTAGAANRGPRLAGRGFDRAFVDKVVRDGVPGTAMPGFKSIAAADLTSVIAYVMNISGGGSTGSAPTSSPSPEPPKFPGPPQALRGKELFFDPVRGIRCGTCHAVEEWGVPIGPNLVAKPPQSAADIRQAKAGSVQTIVVGRDRFQGLIGEKKPGVVQVFDLTVPPPVMRNFLPNELKTETGSWKHASVIQSYSDADLTAVSAYLKWLASR